MRLSNSILNPIVTEKALSLKSQNKYIFRVSMATTKGKVVDELKRIFNVDVIDMHSVIMPGKAKRTLKTKRPIARKIWKKVIVTLKAGQSIDFITNN